MLIVAPSKNTFQNIRALQNCSLKKYISKHWCTSKLLSQKIHFKIFIIKIFLIIILGLKVLKCFMLKVRKKTNKIFIFILIKGVYSAIIRIAI